MYCEKCENYLEHLNLENEKLQNRIEELEERIEELLEEDIAEYINRIWEEVTE